MTPNLVFDVAYDGWTFARYGDLIVVAVVMWVGVVAVMILDRKRLLSLPWRWLVLVLIASVATAVLGVRWYKYRDAIAALADGRCHVIEGVTREYSLRQEGKKFVESFRVDDATFRYSWPQGNIGFRTTRKEGGPMDDGMRVRICYVPDLEFKGTNEILRLEVFH